MNIVCVFAMLNKLKNEEMTNIAVAHSDCFEMNQIVNLSAHICHLFNHFSHHLSHNIMPN